MPCLWERLAPPLAAVPVPRFPRGAVTEAASTCQDAAEAPGSRFVHPAGAARPISVSSLASP